MTAAAERQATKIEQRLFTVSEIELMLTAGIPQEDDPLERIERSVHREEPTAQPTR